MPTLLSTPPLSTADLMWYAPERRYVTEVSDLGPTFRMGRVYDDACDEGVTLIGRDGREVPLVLSHVETHEGDVLYWDLTPARPSDAALFAGLRLFND